MRGGGRSAGRRRKGGRASGAPVPAVLGCASAGRVARVRAPDCGFGPHQGAGRRGRAFVPGHCDQPRRRRRPRRARDDAPCHRRALRSVVEGIHAGDGQGHVRRTEGRKAEGGLHPGDQRRREPYQPDDRRKLPDREGHGHPSGVLRARRRRNRGRQQEQRQDHCRGRRSLRPGLFCLRFAQIGGADDLASSLWPRADRGAVPDRPGGVCGVPSVRGVAAPGSAARRRPGRDGAAECALFGRRDLGPAAAAGAADVHRQEIASVRHRRLGRRARGRPGFADQHDSANLFLRHLRGSATRESHRLHQGVDPQDIRAEGAVDRR